MRSQATINKRQAEVDARVQYLSSENSGLHPDLREALSTHEYRYVGDPDIFKDGEQYNGGKRGLNYGNRVDISDIAFISHRVDGLGLLSSTQSLDLLIIHETNHYGQRKNVYNPYIYEGLLGERSSNGTLATKHEANYYIKVNMDYKRVYGIN